MFYDLFPTRVYKTKIDPSLYNKQEIVEDCVWNYNLNPNRNSWDRDSVLHHTYGDWNNPMFKKIDTTKLSPLYQSAIDDYFSKISFSITPKYRWTLTNICVNTEFMAAHEHFYRTSSSHCMFSCTHYIKFDKTVHPSTTFVSPLKHASIGDNLKCANTLLSSTDTANSSYYDRWNIPTEEDDFVIFPSHLEHLVSRRIKTDKTRIVSVVNIEVDYAK